MPAVRRSARLRAVSPGVHRLRAMDSQPPAGTLQGQHFQGCPPASTGRITIQWREERALTDSLVSFLSSHPVDCRILFSSDGKKLHLLSGESPSGKDKNEIHSVIAKLIFGSHPRYGVLYLDNQQKFRDAVSNRITNLKSRYKTLKAEFRTTGAGVMPNEASNLLAQTLIRFPWYTELDAIWHSNSSFTAKTRKKKAKSDIQQRFDSISDETGSIHSNVMFLEESRNQIYQAKLDAHAEYACETKKYEYLRETRAQEVLQAEANHRRAMESRKTDIRERELEIRAQEKDIQAHEAEVEIWRLKIQFHQMQAMTGDASMSNRGQAN